ncbi:MAG: hypothetical protein KDE33_29805, partial [Bacteroidetes bacterium]|nr:hypothetical protein [Bacteroidota bacterium]
MNELDKELEKRGHKFVRYADDCSIFLTSVGQYYAISKPQASSGSQRGENENLPPRPFRTLGT